MVVEIVLDRRQPAAVLPPLGLADHLAALVVLEKLANPGDGLCMPPQHPAWC